MAELKRPSGILDIKCEIGTTIDFTATYSEKDSGNLINLTGYTAKMQVRDKKPDSEAILTLTSDAGGGITLGGALGTLKIHIKSTQTAALPVGDYYYDLVLSVFNSQLNETVVKKSLRGIFSVIQGVTR